ncbi:hypothetical protein QE152_g4959 [Popillia japonica]|uniref:Uncharacterized protein n=1 Tax=Popillia japonica TaxID=7064 RepID=A0AAW1MRD6_POPJA
MVLAEENSDFIEREDLRELSLVLAEENSDFIEREDLRELSCELDIEIAAMESKDEKTVVVSIYRSPNGNFTTFLIQLNRMLEILDDQSSRVTGHGESCIDNIFTNLERDSSNTETLNLHISDHYAQRLAYRREEPAEPKNMKKTFLKRNLNDENINELNLELQSYLWNRILKNMSAKTMAETFFRMLLQSLDRHIGT